MADGQVVIDSKIDDDGISKGLKAIKFKLKSLDTSLIKTAALGAAITIAPALVPAIAAATVAIMALGASMAAIGIGAVAFGAVTVGVLGQVFAAAEEVARIEEKIANADTVKERIAAQKELAAVYADMSEAQRWALEGLQNFKAFWGDFIKQFETPVFTAFSSSLTLIQSILTGLAPTIGAVGGVVNELLNEMNNAVGSGALTGFFTWLETNAAPALYNFAHISGNVFSGFFSLLGAFSPISEDVENGLLGMTERFAEWAAGLSQSTAFQNFIAYVQENGPILMDTLGNIVDIGKDIVVALAPLGAEVLEGLQWLTDKVLEFTPYLQDASDKALNFVDAVRDNWPAVENAVVGVTVAVGSFVAIMKGLQLIAVINTLMAAYRTGTLAATLAQYGLNTAMLANPITWIVALIAGLIAIGVLLYKNWDTVKEKAGQLWSTIKEKFAEIKEAITKPIGEAKDFIKEQIDKIVGFFSGMKISLPKIKLPHFSVKGSLDLLSLPPKLPKLNVEWMAQGGLVPPNSPRLVGLGDNKRYQEAALPLSPNVLGMIGSKIAKEMPSGSSGRGPTVNVYPQQASIDGNDVLRIFQREMILHE